MKASITLKRRIRRLLKDIDRTAMECDEVVRDTKLKELCKRGNESRKFIIDLTYHIKFCAENLVTELYESDEDE